MTVPRVSHSLTASQESQGSVSWFVPQIAGKDNLLFCSLHKSLRRSAPTHDDGIVPDIHMKHIRSAFCYVYCTICIKFVIWHTNLLFSICI